MTFGDAEPEDSWDATDAVGTQLTNLVRRTEALVERHVRVSGTTSEVLDALAEIVRKARRKRLSVRQRLRADQIDEDIGFVRRRL